MISTADLQEWMKADDADALQLRKLEESAIKAIEERTGRHFGVTAAIVEIIRFRGWPLALANDPNGGTLTTLEQWDGSAWTTVPAADYYVSGNFVWPNATATWPANLNVAASSRRYRATYNAGYTVNPLDADVWPAPADIQQAVLLLVGHWFENREAAVVGAISTEVQLSLDWLLQAHIPASV